MVLSQSRFAHPVASDLNYQRGYKDVLSCQKAQGIVATHADRTALTGEEQKEWEGRKRKMQGCFPDWKVVLVEHAAR